MVDKLNFIKGMICVGLMGSMFQVHAEVLVILPESGPMARAGNSIKLGIDAAHQASKANIQLKFVNSDQKNIKSLLKTHVTKTTQMVIGPLARNEVERLILENPKIPVLALNEVSQQHANVWQYSLSKDEDATALLGVLKKDQIQDIFVLREPGTENDSLNFVNALYKKFQGNVSIVDAIPRLKNKQGVLLLGGNVWLNKLKNKPSHSMYAQAISIEDSQPIPNGLKFCDVPAVYLGQWNDVVNVYQNNPTTMPYQRLYAFGGDAWHIAEQFVLNPKVKNVSFSGRTGKINISSNRVERMPQCFEKKRNGLSIL